MKKRFVDVHILLTSFKSGLYFSLPQRTSRTEMPNLMPPVAMGDRLHRRRRPQPVTMEADAEAAFPAPPDDVIQQQQQQQETTHRRRRPIRADHDANMDAMYRHHAAPTPAPSDELSERTPASYVRTRSGSRDNVGNVFGNDISASRQRLARPDSNSMQQQGNQAASQSNNSSNSHQQKYTSSQSNSAFLRTIARFAKQSQQYSQDDAGAAARVHAHAQHQVAPLQRTSRSHSQPAVHHLHNMNSAGGVGGGGGEFQQPPSRYSTFCNGTLHISQVSIGGSKGGTRHARPLSPGPNSFIFMQFSAKKSQKIG